MPKFGSQEWAEAYHKALNDNPDYYEAGGPDGFPPDGWEGDFIFEIEPDGPLNEKITMWIGLLHGKCTGAKILGPDDQYKLIKPGEKAPEGVYGVEFVYSAKYTNWVKILKKELDSIRALLSGQAKLQGDMAKVMRATKAAQAMVDTTTKIDTEFY